MSDAKRPWWKFWEQSGAAQRTTTIKIGNTHIEMVQIPAGTFLMGSNDGNENEEHR